MNISGYTRISVDIEQDRDNTSIENQKAIISDYVATYFPQAKLTLYEDRDRSGYTFEQREGYQQMRPKLFSGESQILIIKDFSRFSRRNSLGLLELETLRDAGVRIISINDGIDYPTKDDWMLIQFKFLMNEMPVTDTSKKIKAIIQHRQKNGEWVCAVPYGYRMINTKEMVYEVDPPAAEVVREIFALYNSGWGYKRIANHLTDKGIPTPRANEIAWKEAQGRQTRLKSKAEWSIISVSSILCNDFYVGTLRQKKYTRANINGKDKRLDEDEHIVIENAHTPIIDARTFAYTQEQLKLRSRSNYRGEKKYATDYSGFLYCGDCGAPMFSMSRPDLKPAYTCGTYHRRGRKGCTSHHVRVDKLDELLKSYIQIVRDNSTAILERLQDAIKQQPEREQEIGNAIDSLERQLAESKEQLKTMYKRKLIDTMGKAPDEAAIIDEAYTELEKDLTHRIAGLEHQIDVNIDSRNHLLQANRAAKTVIEVFDDILTKPKLDKRDISLIVDRITVYEDHIDIQLKPDVDGLLATGVWEESSNFPQDSRDNTNLPAKIVQSATCRPSKVFTVNVINSGDPSQITLALWQRFSFAMLDLAKRQGWN
jgi:DNA invertase Pin-like site-specific DNA recombinase